MIRHLFIVFCLLLSLASCRDDEEQSFASIEGNWVGTLAEIEFKPLGLPIPVREDIESFDTEMEFRADGTLVVNDDNTAVEGTYEVINNKLVVDVDYSIEDISLSGTYTIKKLTDTRLVVELEKDETVTDPDSGKSISGKAKATLHFDKR